MNTEKNNINNTHEAGSVSEEQIAHCITDLLTDHAQHVTAVTAQRLLNARNLAVSQLAAQQTQAIHQNGNVLQLFGDHVGHYVGHHRVMSAALVVVAMLLTFFAIQQLGFNNNLENSDAFLLASDLPPEAYADKGFDTWLVTKQD